jgi:ubiquinol-cytochrome c reductase iron-sulfur subunit
MSETTGSPEDRPAVHDDRLAEENRIRQRVIGTPSPAEARTVLGAARQDGGRQPELPADPSNLPQAKRVERVVALLFTLAFLAGVGFIAAYVGIEVHGVLSTLHSNLALGVSLSVALLALAVGAVLWVRYLMPHIDLTEARKPLASPEEDRAAFTETFTEGADASQFVKRPLLRRTLMLATLPLAVIPVVLLRDLGPLPGLQLRHTVWKKGTRLLVYGPNTPLRPADFSTPGQMITVVPDGYADNQDALAKATTIIIKFAPGQLVPKTPTQQGTVMNWTVDNIVAYSKICTHVGCPVALYEQTTHHILCPCHQSTFDATRGATVIFGPAPRALPQLPLGVDSEGYLIATSDYHVPVGPSFWELGGSGFTGGNES